MNTLQFLAEWALRSSALILCGGLLLWVSRVKNPSIRLTAWTAVLCGSLTIPMLGTALPDLSFAVPPTIPIPELQPASIDAPLPQSQIHFSAGNAPSGHQDLARATQFLYLLVTGVLLLRLLAGSILACRLRRSSRDTGLSSDGIRILESERVASPVTLGLPQPAVVLPCDWGQWESDKLAAVLAHERSHVLRHDPAVQLLSALHRSFLWFNPLSWFLHRSIVQLAEEASDDAALTVTRDRASYAELLLDFMQRGVRGHGLQAIAMARYGRPEKRIDRILEDRAIPRGVTRKAVATIVLIGLPMVFVAAAAVPGMKTARTAAAKQAAPPSASSTTQAGSPSQIPQIQAYIIRMGDHLSVSWGSRDPVDEQSLRRRFGERYAWFKRDGKEYMITDSGVLAELEKAMEPQKKVNRLQSEMNALQAKVNEKQSGVNAPQQSVNAMQQRVNAVQQEVNRRQDLVNRIQRAVQEGVNEELVRNLEETLRELRAGRPDVSQESVNRLQAEVNRAQEEVNKAQAQVNLEQEKVNQQQERVNEEQRRVSAEFSRRVRDIIDNAVRRGLAQVWN